MSSRTTPTRRGRSTTGTVTGRSATTASARPTSERSAASTPTRSQVGSNGTTPLTGTRPGLGAMPTTPHCDAGSRTDPPVSVPTARSASPTATAAAEPPELPPGLRPRSHGLCVGPCTEVAVEAPMASSSMLARPSTTAPARRSRATTGASRSAGTRLWASEAHAVTWPATSMLSLTTTTTPWSGPTRPDAAAASSLRAAARAPGASTCTRLCTRLSVVATSSSRRATSSSTPPGRPGGGTA